MDNGNTNRRGDDSPRQISPPLDGADGLRNRRTVLDDTDATHHDCSRLATPSAQIVREIEKLKAQICHLLAKDRKTSAIQPELSEHHIECLILAKKAIAGIAIRERHLAPEMFINPGWNMLLDLYTARILQGEVSVSSLTIASKVPGTTALRHLADLERNGDIRRRSDPFDRRRSLIEITDSAFDRMTACLLDLRDLGQCA